MKKKILLIGIIAMSFNLKAQDTKDEFQAEGNVYGTIFSNFHSSLNSDIDNSGFEIQRAYFGYKYKMSSDFSANVKLDIGTDNSLNLKRYTFIKNAELQYKKENLKINFGMINLYQFGLQKNIWGHRYILKTIQNQHKFGHSADLGISAVYKFSNFISADIAITNGEGYTLPQLDETYKSAVGITFTPNDKISARVYADYIEKQEKEMTFSAFLAYLPNDDLKFGVEYALKNNKDYIDEHNIHGLSATGSYDINEKFEVFGRFDNLSPNTLDGDNDAWNYNNDGRAIIGGVQYKPTDKLKIAANIQDWAPADGSEIETYFYINVECKLK
ncbi:MAG: hypothetical protein PF487_13860 [Bacteroidales bacterium]|jgi:hypothetical protein|nr:hypothetical protein [Bacteroidales bacterium]